MYSAALCRPISPRIPLDMWITYLGMHASQEVWAEDAWRRSPVRRFFHKVPPCPCDGYRVVPFVLGPSHISTVYAHTCVFAYMLFIVFPTSISLLSCHSGTHALVDILRTSIRRLHA
jgi:hypothetical protein